jgi:hypothetical protein
MPMVVSLSYGELVMPTEDAVQLLKILERAELYRLNYHNDGATGKSESTHHIFPNETPYHARLITEDFYRMAKLAGKPEKD